jgi:hypothetical protein
MPSVIDALYEQNRLALSFLYASGEVSLASDLDNKLKKHLIMAAASYFESEVRELIENFAQASSNGNAAVVSLIKNKALERQYHTYFDWEKRNANKFFAHFGEPFNGQCRAEVRDKEGLTDAVSAFLELGEMRNKLAHLNFAIFPIDKTSDEVYALYKRACAFVEYLSESLRRASQSGWGPDASRDA